MSSMEATNSTPNKHSSTTTPTYFNLSNHSSDAYHNNAMSTSKAHVNHLNSKMTEDRNLLLSCANSGEKDSGISIPNGISNSNEKLLRKELISNPVNGHDVDSGKVSSIEFEPDSSHSSCVSLSSKATNVEELSQPESMSKPNLSSDVDKLAEQKYSELSGALSNNEIGVVSEYSDNVEHLSSSLQKTALSESHCDMIDGITYVVYESEKQMPDIMRLITKDLSEPYSIYTYRYFIHNWPKLCFLAMDGDLCIGAIVCKLDLHKKMARRRGYIAMLAVDSAYRRRKLGSTLVTKAIQAMIRDDCDEVVLETEITNQAALHLYENLGFVRDKRLFRYYLNGVDALRLKLWLR